MVRYLCKIAISILFLLAPADAARAAQVAITGILGPDSTAVEQSDDVELTPWGEFARGGISAGQPLNPGDELRAHSGRTIVEVTCADTAVFTLTGEFRAVIRGNAPPCYVLLEAGEVHAVGGANTGVGVGPVIMGAERTVYVVAARRDPAGPVPRLTVFEGAVAVRGLERRREISAGSVLNVARESRIEPVSEAEINRAASLYARLDLGKARSDARRSADAYRSLFRAHARVLATPEDQAGRIRLINEQLRYNASSRTTLYHIEHVAPRTADARAATTALAAAAYAQLGRPADEAARLDSLRAIDQATLQRVVRQYDLEGTAAAEALRIRPESRRIQPNRNPFIRDSLRVSVTAGPTAVRAGQTIRIVVTVRSGRGQQVAGAAVTVAAAAGEFVGVRGLESGGVTGDDGTFAIVWRCARCAGPYEYRVRATKSGYRAGESSARVTVR